MSAFDAEEFESLEESSSLSSASSYDSSSSDEERRRRRRRKRRRRSRRSRRRERSRSHAAEDPGPQAVPDAAAAPPSEGADGRYAEKARVVMCSEHDNDLRPLACRACKAMNYMIRKNLRQHLVVDVSEAPSAVPKAKDRLLGKRSDQEEPTLVFSEDEVAVLEAIFG